MFKQISAAFLLSVLASAAFAGPCESFLLVLKTDSSSVAISHGCAAMGISGTASITSCDGFSAVFKSPAHTEQTTAQFDLVGRPRLGDFHQQSSYVDSETGAVDDTLVSINVLENKFLISKNTKISRTHATSKLICSGTIESYELQK
jgi:hypothetical protein